MWKQYFVTTVLFLLLVCRISLTLAQDENQTQAVRQTVESYCKIEFDGQWVPARWAMIKYGRKFGGSIEREYFKFYKGVFDLDDLEPFIVVTSYNIREIKMLSSKRATANIIYHRVAHSGGDFHEYWQGWYLVADPMDNDIVTLNLGFEKNNWYVLDPPPPRISKARLIEFYENKLKRLDIENDPIWQHKRDALKLLKSLP